MRINIDSERCDFEAAYALAHPKAQNPFHRHRYGYYMRLGTEGAWQGWLARASRPVVVTDEMALQGAWGPINEFAQRVGLQPFDPRMAPDINEIERVRLILSAALNMATNGAPKEKAGS